MAGKAAVVSRRFHRRFRRLRRLGQFGRRIGRPALKYAVIVLIVGFASMALSLRITPPQSVTALGETVGVGAAAPSLSFSGPGELDLFGQAIPTKPHFDGPVRPRLVLSHITVNRQVAAFLQPASRGKSQTLLGRQLANGWTRYFIWEVVIVALCAVVLLGAFAGWRRYSTRKTVRMLIIGMLVIEVLNLASIISTVSDAPRILGRLASLDQLVGRSPTASIPPDSGPPVKGVQAIVLGDSTAAGVGNPLVPSPTDLDRACGRSADSYAAMLAEVNDWNVMNLGCSGATIDNGLLGPQGIEGQVAPAQLSIANHATKVPLVVVSVGADDLNWSAVIELCAIASTCDNQAATAYLQSNLAQFTQHYYDLLSALGRLPAHPLVLINSYYDPFGVNTDCLRSDNLTKSKVQVLVSDLSALNAVLAKGAKVFGFVSVLPDFAGHGICSARPYVQGLYDNAPFHPTVAGSLSIALADEHALAIHHLPTG
jgi:hypothetical protein